MPTLEEKIVSHLKDQPNIALKYLYEGYYGFVCGVIYKMIGDKYQAEDIAQEVFVEVWNRRDTLEINSTLQGYLRRTAVNKTLNHLRKRKLDVTDTDEVFDLDSGIDNSDSVMEANDLQAIINQSVDSLPEKCRIIFGLNKFEELSYKEIANNLGISIKTVENQMSKALKIVRQSIKLNYEL